MKKYIFLFFFNCASCIVHCAFSQAPLLKIWDKRFGGTNLEALNSVQKTRDGGYMLAGSSFSGMGGDKTQVSQGNHDYWIVKVDSSGILQWERSYGGNLRDILEVVTLTNDGGYLLCGTSCSGISGDKTSALKDTAVNLGDYWIIKIDSVGNQQWDQDFGGKDADILYDVIQTTDRCFILAGVSSSAVNGDKTEPLQDSIVSGDYWIIKIDSLGNKLWDKDYGGKSLDRLQKIILTTDDCYLLGGMSNSGVGGDKSQPAVGMGDYWILKIDAAGNTQWDKDFGGPMQDNLFALQQTVDSGFILAGSSYSSIGGDKTENVWGLAGSDADFWIIKTDSLGIKQWDKDLGGTSVEELFACFQTQDSGYIFSGDSYSPVSGNKTEANTGGEQTWLVKINESGAVQWDKTIHTNGHDETGLVIDADDNCIVCANNSNSDVAGEKSEPAWNLTYDYWIIKFCDTTQAIFPAALFTAPNHICPGTCTDFTNISVNASSFYWSFPGATPSSSTDINPAGICYSTPGTYDVMLIATCPGGTDTLALSNFMTVYPFPAPQGITQNGDTLFSNSGANTYQWYLNGNVINGATNYFYVAAASGDYNVVASDVNGCEVEAAIFNVVANTAFVVAGLKFEVFPNPVDKEFIIQNSAFKIENANDISIYNFLGERIYLAVDCSLRTVDCELLPPGLYFLELVSGNKTFRTKFVKH